MLCCVCTCDFQKHTDPILLAVTDSRGVSGGWSAFPVYITASCRDMQVAFVQNASPVVAE
jgi:hypothetical protein